jgi:hypothetical protein
LDLLESFKYYKVYLYLEKKKKQNC